jgi:hypothetical protein
MNTEYVVLTILRRVKTANKNNILFRVTGGEYAGDTEGYKEYNRPLQNSDLPFPKGTLVRIKEGIFPLQQNKEYTLVKDDKEVKVRVSGISGRGNDNDLYSVEEIKTKGGKRKSKKTRKAQKSRKGTRRHK